MFEQTTLKGLIKYLSKYEEMLDCPLVNTPCRHEFSQLQFQFFVIQFSQTKLETIRLDLSVRDAEYSRSDESVFKQISHYYGKEISFS